MAAGDVFPLKMRETQAGRGYVSSRRLKQAEVVLRVAPAAAVVHDEAMGHRCSRCFELATPGCICAGCRMVRFCDSCSSCCHARSEHRAECAALRRLGGKPARRALGLTATRTGSSTTVLRLCIRLLTLRSRTCRRPDRPPLLLGDPDTADTGHWAACTDDPVMHDSWDDVEQLMPMDDDSADQFASSLPTKTAHEIEGGVNAIRRFGGNPGRAPLRLVHRLLCQIVNNSMALLPEGKVRSATSSRTDVGWRDFGVGLFPSGAIFNHSCDPNCMWFVRHGTLIVETIRGVKKGEELTIMYLPVKRERDVDVQSRRQRLRREFGFTCCCYRCEADATKLKKSVTSGTQRRNKVKQRKKRGTN